MAAVKSGKSIKLLGLETSSSIFSVAVSEGDRILSSMAGAGMGRPSALLTDFIQQALTKAGLTLETLDGFAISIGPGSFTGLRVGVATVKTLAWALHKKIISVSSLEVMAQNERTSQHPVAAYLDARKGKVYSALFAPGSNGWLKRSMPDALTPPEEPLQKWKGKGPTLLLGDGMRRYADLVQSIGQEKFILADESRWIPKAEILCQLAAQYWPVGVVDDPHALVPQYLYSKESDITGW